MGKLADLWKKAKADFEKATGKQKPAEIKITKSLLQEFLFFPGSSAVRMASQIQPALERLDAAETESHRDDALAGFRKVAEAYGALLKKTRDKLENGSNDKRAVEKLHENLENIWRLAVEDIAKARAIEGRARTPRKGKVGPLNFNLLGGVQAMKAVRLPRKLAIIVEMEIEFAGVDFLLVDKHLKKGVSDYMEGRKDEVAKVVWKADLDLHKEVLKSAQSILDLEHQGKADEADREKADLGAQRHDAAHNLHERLKQLAKETKERAMLVAEAHVHTYNEHHPAVPPEIRSFKVATDVDFESAE